MISPLLAQFVGEAADLLAELDVGLLRLEGDPNDTELMNSVFRGAHTLKGSSGLFELPELTRLTHAAEDLLDAVRSGRLDLTRGMVDDLLAAFDAVRGWMPAIEATGRAPGEAAEVGQALSLRLRAPLGIATDEWRPSTTTVPSAKASTDGSPLPQWVNDIGADTLAEMRSWLELTGASVRAFVYRPDAECFFRGEDPLHLVRQVPALHCLAIDMPAGSKLDSEYDEYRCVVRFTALSRASSAEIDHIFRYIPDQLQVVEVTGPGLVQLATPASEGDSTFLPAPGTPPLPIDEVVAALIGAQRHLLEVSGGGPATLMSAVEATVRLAGALCPTDENGTATTMIDLVMEAGREAVASGSPGPLLVGLEALSARHDPPHQAAVATSEQIETFEALPQTNTGEPSSDVAEFRADDAGGGTRILKIEQSKVDRLLDLVGELAVAKNALPFVAAVAAEEGNRVLARRISDEYAVVSRVTEELQQAVMDVRMLPVSTAFARAPRMVRDLSQKLGKRVRLVQEGEDTAADKDVIEMLAEPLMHLVRNSLDHGIEGPAEREATGKPPVATLTLRAAPDGDAVIVAVIDDGAGLDIDRVRSKAYERGVIDEAAMESLSDSQIADLIFAPGFSTAEQISEVSGRGVGMDAVRTSVERLGGTVSVDNRPGLGVTVALRLPLTMAVSRVLLITAGDQRFGVPLDDVIETVRTPIQTITYVAGREVLVMRQKVVPLARLTALLDLPCAAPAEDVSVLVVKTATGPLGLVVDQFHRNTDVILKPLEGLLSATPGYCGTALLGDGLVLLVLDVKELNARATALV